MTQKEYDERLNQFVHAVALLYMDDIIATEEIVAIHGRLAAWKTSNRPAPQPKPEPPPG